jgi:hypothetical protein
MLSHTLYRNYDDIRFLPGNKKKCIGINKMFDLKALRNYYFLSEQNEYLDKKSQFFIMHSTLSVKLMNQFQRIQFFLGSDISNSPLLEY